MSILRTSYTKNKNLQQYLMLNTEISRTLVFSALGRTFWNLSPDLNYTVALTEIF